MSTDNIQLMGLKYTKLNRQDQVNINRMRRAEFNAKMRKHNVYKERLESKYQSEGRPGQVRQGAEVGSGKANDSSIDYPLS